MGIYLGYIDVKQAGMSVFYNFKPIYEMLGTKLSYLTSTDRGEILPESEYGNINFYCTDPNYEIGKHLFNEQYVILDFVLTDLEENYSFSGERNRTGYKLDISKIESDKLREISDLGMFQFINKEDIESNFKATNIVLINGIGLYQGQKLLLEIDDKTVLGPYEVGFRVEDSKYYINTRHKENKYVVKTFTFNGEDCKEFVESIGSFGNERDILVLPATADAERLDVITDELLLQSFRESLSGDIIKDGALNLSNINDLLVQYQTSYFVGANLPGEVQEQRLERLRSLLSDEDKLVDTFNFISEIIPDLLLKYQDTPQFKDLLERISTDEVFMGKVQSFRIITDRITDISNELESLRRQKSSIEADIAQKGSLETAAEVLTEHKDEIEALNNEKVDIQSSIDYLRERLNILEDFSDLHERLNHIKEVVDYKEKREKELDTKISRIEARLDQKFEDIAEKAVDFAFDEMLANKLLQQAALWENDQTKNRYAEIAKALKTLSLSNLHKKELVEYIVGQISYYRAGYGRNDIINIMICITQNFLTVFSGEPGTGKTSICNIVAHVLGLTRPEHLVEKSCSGHDINRYITISVERGWTSKRDFIGYYNPLTKTFDKNNRKLFDSFCVLNQEARGASSDLPFMVLLDEANLSPMEYYWADFMNICDDRNEYSSVNLGEDYQLSVPESLRFVATINNDHTTETLSPRLLDRAWVVVLPQVPSGTAREVKFDDSTVESIAWSSLVTTFCNTKDEMVIMNGEAKEIYEKIYTIFRMERVVISQRSDKAIRKYWSVAQAMFEADSYGTDPSILALDYAIAQKVLPQISGNGDPYRSFLAKLCTLCEEKYLRRSATILRSVIDNGDVSMKYYQFFN